MNGMYCRKGLSWTFDSKSPITFAKYMHVYLSIQILKSKAIILLFPTNN